MPGKGEFDRLVDSIDFHFNWGVLCRSKISRAEHHTLFANLEPICSLNASLYSKVGWNIITIFNHAKRIQHKGWFPIARNE